MRGGGGEGGERSEGGGGEMRGRRVGSYRRDTLYLVFYWICSCHISHSRSPVSPCTGGAIPGARVSCRADHAVCVSEHN